MSKIRIGWAETNITPEKKISLQGQFAERISQYVEKPLTATTEQRDICLLNKQKSTAITAHLFQADRLGMKAETSW